MNILEEIIAFKRAEVEKRKVAIKAAQLEEFGFFNETSLSLKASLKDKSKTRIIAEFKRKSPSKGMINADAEVFAVTRGYAEGGAAGISVLTDTHFFGGSIDDLIKARINRIPILRKDFIIDEYQLIESKAIGADVILLIAACLDKEQTRELAKQAKALGMEVLLEIHDEHELDHICEEVDLVGVNNRNLKTFSVDLDQSIRLSEKIGNGKLTIAESGINDPSNILYLANHGFNGFLVGERFMREPDPGKAFKEFVQDLKFEI